MKLGSQCELCGEMLNRHGRTSNLVNHIKTVHPALLFEVIAVKGKPRYFCSICNHELSGGQTKGGAHSLESKLMEHFRAEHNDYYLSAMVGNSTSVSKSPQAPLSAVTGDQIIDAIVGLVTRVSKAESAAKALQPEIERLKKELDAMHKGFEAQSREISSITLLNNNLRAENTELKAEVSKSTKRVIDLYGVMQEKQNIINAQ